MGLQLTTYDRLPSYFPIFGWPSGIGMFSFDATTRLTNELEHIHPAFGHFSDTLNWQQSYSVRYQEVLEQGLQTRSLGIER